MIKRIVFLALALLMSVGVCGRAWGGEIDILVDKLVQKGILTPNEAKVVLDETKQEVAKQMSKGEAISAPEWTQKIKVKGDIRLRTQADWGKDLAGTSGHAPYELRQRIRARIALEGKVNDQLYGGVRFASGSSSSARSTNQTLDDVFTEKSVWFDQFYINWQPKLKYLDTTSFWFGKFENVIKTTPMIWDSDINPEGIGITYTSPSFSTSFIPEINFYGNFGMYWMDEISTAMTDSMLWIWQLGFKALLNSDSGTLLNFAIAYWNPTHIQDRSAPNGSAGTNTRWGTYPTDTHLQYYNNMRYDYDMLDLYVSLDNNLKIEEYGIDLPHGIFGEIVYNPAVDDLNLAYSFGGYIGKKKVKNPGEWKASCDFRYIERDAILDAFPDSDFYGFAGNGAPKEGGTNTYGVKIGLEYVLLKNTYLNLAYFWTHPIKDIEELSSAVVYDGPRQLFQADVTVKF